MCGNLKVIGLVGASATGKSTLSKVLAEQGYKRIAMAKPLKDMLAVLGMTHEDLYGPPAHRAAPSDFLCGRSPRHVMQALGTLWGRIAVGPELWVNAVQEQVVSYQTECATCGKPALVVIEDIRFPNEWSMIQRLGGVLWRVRRPAVEPKIGWLCHLVNAPVRWKRIVGAIVAPLVKPFGITPTHESEYHWPSAPAEAEFWNTGTPEELAAQVRELVRRCTATCEGTKL